MALVARHALLLATGFAQVGGSREVVASLHGHPGILSPQVSLLVHQRVVVGFREVMCGLVLRFFGRIGLLHLLGLVDAVREGGDVSLSKR